MKRNTFLTLGAGMVGFLLTTGYLVTLFSCGPEPGKDLKSTTGEGWFPGKVKAGHLVSLDQAPLFIAKEAGFFKEEGLDLETVFFSNPGDNNAALTGGSIQFSTNPFTLPYLAANSNVPMKIISSAGGLGIMEVIIQGNYGVKDLKSLATYVKANPKKKLKVAALKGDTLDMILYRGFQGVGLSYTDFDMVWFNDLLAMVQSFQTKQVDILSHIQPYTTDMVVNHGAIKLTDNSEVWGKGTPNCTVAVMQDFLQKYPNTVKAYLRGLYRGFNLIVTDPQRATDLLTKGNYFKVDPKVLLYAFQNQKEVVLEPNINGMNTAIEDMVTQGYIKRPPAGVVDIALLQQVLREPHK
jgi:ABC-type nitrate/sulfonate/bicarbonate transport system substrate-binding protein